MTPQGIYQPRRSARLLWLATPLFARLSPKLTQRLPALNHLSAASEGEVLFLHKAEKPRSGGGPLLLRRKTPLTRRSVA
jgi:hypothetical protein